MKMVKDTVGDRTTYTYRSSVSGSIVAVITYYYITRRIVVRPGTSTIVVWSRDVSPQTYQPLLAEAEALIRSF